MYANCRELYCNDVCSVLSRGTGPLHSAVLEALYKLKFDSMLCFQKENVLSV